MEQKIDIAELLSWYIEAGVDTTCGNDCCLINTSATQPINKTTNIRPAVTSVIQSTNEFCKNARDLCLKANNLAELKEFVEKFEGCALKLTAKSTVFGCGPENASVVIIGEAPGADEDRLGLPFVGRSGHLLDKMLKSINFNREDVYITNVLPWRPPGNRTPTDAEIAICIPFLQRQIELAVQARDRLLPKLMSGELEV